jgi:hypothetical protein
VKFRTVEGDVAEWVVHEVRGRWLKVTSRWTTTEDTAATAPPEVWYNSDNLLFVAPAG